MKELEKFCGSLPKWSNFVPVREKGLLRARLPFCELPLLASACRCR